MVATQDQAKWALLQAIIGAAGVAGVVWSLYYSRLATKAALSATRVAEKAAADADESIEVSRMSAEASMKAAEATERHAELMERQLTVVERAHLFGGLRDLALDAQTGQASLKITVLNAGRTPARMRMIRFAVFPHPNVEPPPLPDVPDYDQFAQFPQDTIFTAGQDGAVIGIPDAAPWGIAAGVIEYDDIFGKPHKSRFCIRYNAAAATAHTHGNDAWNEFD